MMNVIQPKYKPQPPKVTIFDRLPKSMVDFLSEAGAISRFAGKFFKQAFRAPFESKELFRQSFERNACIICRHFFFECNSYYDLYQ